MNNDDYVLRSKAIEAIDESLSCVFVTSVGKSIMDKVPSEDAAPVRRGKWIKGTNHGFGVYTITCNQCGHSEATSVAPNFCSNCGSKNERVIPW